MQKRQKKDKKITKKLGQNSHHFGSFFGVDLSHSLTAKKYFFIFLRFFLTFGEISESDFGTLFSWVLSA
jgi:hypothetical protein